MAEIIRAGRIPEEEWCTCTCNSCRTYFKFQRKEANVSGDQRDPGYHINCPLCSKQCWMNTLTKLSSTIDPY